MSLKGCWSCNTLNIVFGSVTGCWKCSPALRRYWNLWNQNTPSLCHKRPGFRGGVRWWVCAGECKELLIPLFSFHKLYYLCFSFSSQPSCSCIVYHPEFLCSGCSRQNYFYCISISSPLQYLPHYLQKWFLQYTECLDVFCFRIPKLKNRRFRSNLPILFYSVCL